MVKCDDVKVSLSKEQNLILIIAFSADIIVVDRVHHMHSFTDSPPNEFRLQETDSMPTEQDDDDDEKIMEKTHVNIIPNLDEPVPTDITESNRTVEDSISSNDKENKIPEQSITMNESTITLIPTNDLALDGMNIRFI
jgi:hypothetical protein